MPRNTYYTSSRWRRYLVGLLAVGSLTTLAGCSGDGGNPVGPTLVAEESTVAMPVEIQPVDTGPAQASIEICHRLQGGNEYALRKIAESALPAHLAHGDARPGEAVPTMPGFVFDAACNPVGTQRSRTFRGVLAGGGDVSGTVEVVVPASSVTASATRRSLAVVTAAGTANLTGIGSVVLTGTWDDVTGALELSGDGYQFSGTLSGGSVTGTFTGPGVIDGVFTALEVVGGPVATYCGTYAGDATGVWNLAEDATGQVLGAYSGDGGAGGVIGQRAGNRLSGQWGDSHDEGTYRGTISGNSVSGTWTSSTGTDRGTFRGRKGNCR